MAGAGPIDMNELIPGQEYTFIFNDEDRIYGMLKTYVANNRGPRGAVTLANGSRRNGVLQDGPQTFPLNSVTRVVKGNSMKLSLVEGRYPFSQPIIQAQPAYREGMRPSERFMKHGWKAQGERHVDAIHNRNPINVDPDTYIDIRNVNRNTKPRSNYYSPEEIANMRATITKAKCSICLDEINDDTCRVCINGHKFHLTHEGQTIPTTFCPECMAAPPFYSCNGNYNDIMSGGKKQKGGRKKSKKSRRKLSKRRKSSRRRKY